MYKAGVEWGPFDLGHVRQEVINAELSGVTVVSWVIKPDDDRVAGTAYVGTLCSKHGYNVQTFKGYDWKRVAALVSSK